MMGWAERQCRHVPLASFHNAANLGKKVKDT
jgi:hypothetical protein